MKPAWSSKGTGFSTTAASAVLGLMLALTSGLSGRAAVHYVDVNNPSPFPPYTTWATAATSIQDAVDAAMDGDQVLVTNGVYRSGGRVVSGALTNRLAVTKALAVQSANGPTVTTIEGFQVPGTTNGDSALRCVWLSPGASLSGFTLTNGATRAAGDSTEQSGGGVFAASANCVVSNCVLAANQAAQEGGGAYGATLKNCVLSGNTANLNGGGACASTLNNCALFSNAALWSGGGACASALNNCTLTGNSAAGSGGGVWAGTLHNCVVYYNTAPDGNYDWQSRLNSCCTTPLPSSGTGNLGTEPQLASVWHLSRNSPCRGAGDAVYAGGADLDNDPWNNPPAMGCDEYWSGAVTGALSVAILANYTNVAAGFPMSLQALITGKVSDAAWDFGDGTVVSNRPYATHAWAAAGDYSVSLRAYNESAPGGVAAFLTIHVVARPVHYVALTSTNPVAPYSAWAQAATNIQDAVDAAAVAGALVLVSNGVYQSGARPLQGMSNRVTVTRALSLQSLNGTQAATISGAAETRCVYLAGGAVLSGFTLANGAGQNAGDVGGGAWCESITALLTNCLILSNSVSDHAGGCYSGTLNNCTLTGNASGATGSTSAGGGAYFAVLSNCVLTANTGNSGGGAFASILTQCRLTNNSANFGGGVAGGTLNNCTLAKNSGYYEGGATVDSRLTNCVLLSNLAAAGAGASRGTLNNCVLATNLAGRGIGGSYAIKNGGGTYFAILNNCTLVGNSSPVSGGGTYFSTANNCVVYYNSAPDGNYDTQSSLGYCCTTPLAAGPANFTNAPGLVAAARGNWRLQSNSPCINAGRNVFVSTGLDLDGNPRIIGGTVDVGPYEFTAPVSAISYAWLLQYGLPLASTTDTADPDRDGLNNWQEWIAGTDPTNAASVLRLLPPTVPAPGLLLSWNSDTQRTYFVERASAMALTFSTIVSNIAGEYPSTAYVDAPPLVGEAALYRVGTLSGNPVPPIQVQVPLVVPTPWALVRWTSVSNRSYTLERAASLASPPAFSIIATNLPGQPAVTTYMDTQTTNQTSLFYRVRVEQ